MPSFSYDLRYLQAGADVLEEFILSKDVYWPVGVQPPGGEPPYPQLTPGGISLATARATAASSQPEDQIQLTRTIHRIDAARQQWRAAWGIKAAQEIRGRLIQWRNYIEEYRESPNSHYDRYEYEVFRRVIIQLLEPTADGLSNTDNDLIIGLDNLLKALLKADRIIWDPIYESIFPRDKFWYLYGRLTKEGAGNKK